MENNFNAGLIDPDKKLLKPFMRFREQVFSVLESMQPERKDEQFDKIVSKLWRDMSKAERDVFIRDYEKDLEQFREETPVYCVGNQLSSQPNYQYHSRRLDLITKAFYSKNGLVTQFAPNVFIVEEFPEIGDVHSVRKIAAYRYMLNSLLMDSIFDPRKVTDSDFSFVAKHYASRRSYASYLMSAQENISSQLELLISGHKAKLRYIEDSRKSFDEEIADEICKTVVI